MPNSRFALHGLALHGLCAIFTSNARFMRLFRPLLTTVSTAPSWPASQFTVCSSRFAHPPNNIFCQIGWSGELGAGISEGDERRRLAGWPRPLP